MPDKFAPILNINTAAKYKQMLILETKEQILVEDPDWADIKEDVLKIRENNESGEIVMKYVHGVLKRHIYAKSKLHNTKE